MWRVYARQWGVRTQERGWAERIPGTQIRGKTSANAFLALGFTAIASGGQRALDWPLFHRCSKSNGI